MYALRRGYSAKPADNRGWRPVPCVAQELYRLEDMEILSVSRGAVTRVMARVGRKTYEYTSLGGAAFEVYDFPRAWKGVARHLGWLSGATSLKLFTVLDRWEDWTLRSFVAR